MPTLDWLIIGGGIHGVHLAIRLLATGTTRHARVRVLDPHPQPLACWDRCTHNVGMEFLRSPAVHQLGASPFDLYNFLRERGPIADASVFTAPYNRPSLAVFRAHCQALAQQFELAKLWLRGRATGIAERDGALAVDTDVGQLCARRVILALGLGEQLHWPAWAEPLRAAGAPVTHMLGPDIIGPDPTATGAVVVVGGGLSGAQAALRWSRLQPGRVTLVTRHPLRVAQFDSDPGWLGPLNLAAFQRTADLGLRRRMITEARHRGSMPPDIRIAVDAAEAAGELRVVHDTIVEAAVGTDGVRLRLTQTGLLPAARVILATGFEPCRPGGAWLSAAIAQLGLPCAACGYPRVDRSLHWHPRLQVSGPLAELEIGPAARNIAGARMAGERIVSAA